AAIETQCSSQTDCVEHALCNDEDGGSFCKCEEDPDKPWIVEDGHCKLGYWTKCDCDEECVKNALCTQKRCKCIENFSGDPDQCGLGSAQTAPTSIRWRIARRHRRQCGGTFG
ncbi:unnamed protein product, partial [Darwinula stevensoni]